MTSPSADSSRRRRMGLLLGVGVLGAAALIAIPGPEFAPYVAPADPAREVTPSMTPPRVLNDAEVLAYLGNAWDVAGQGQHWPPGTWAVRVRVNEQGRITGMPVVAGRGYPEKLAEGVVRQHRFAPALDEEGRPVPVWWTVPITVPPVMTLALNGMARGPIAGWQIPTVGDTIAALLREGPTFTPLTVLPRVLNPDAVEGAIERSPVPLVPHHEGRVFFLIDRTGRVRDVRHAWGSSNSPSSAALLDVARVYRFSPALNEGTPVPVWVSFPALLPRASSPGGDG